MDYYLNTVSNNNSRHIWYHEVAHRLRITDLTDIMRGYDKSGPDEDGEVVPNNGVSLHVLLLVLKDHLQLGDDELATTRNAWRNS
jgi:hypothetical protein